jgi:hypothetical protein
MSTHVVESVKASVAPGQASAATPESKGAARAYRAPEVHEVGTLHQMLGSTNGSRRDNLPFCVYWNS